MSCPCDRVHMGRRARSVRVLPRGCGCSLRGRAWAGWWQRVRARRECRCRYGARRALALRSRAKWKYSRMSAELD
eukprot:937391-Prymnesium_polylepis.1